MWVIGCAGHGHWGASLRGGTCAGGGDTWLRAHGVQVIAFGEGIIAVKARNLRSNGADLKCAGVVDY